MKIYEGLADFPKEISKMRVVTSGTFVWSPMHWIIQKSFIEIQRSGQRQSTVEKLY